MQLHIAIISFIQRLSFDCICSLVYLRRLSKKFIINIFQNPNSGYRGFLAVSHVSYKLMCRPINLPLNLGADGGDIAAAAPEGPGT